MIGPGFDKNQLGSFNLRFSILLIFFLSCTDGASTVKETGRFDQIVCILILIVVHGSIALTILVYSGGRSCRGTSGCVQQPAHSAQEPTVSLLDLLGQSHLSTLLAHLVVDKTRLHSSSPAALNPDHCHYHKELLNVKPRTKKTTRKAGQCGLQLTCVVGRTAAPRLRLDRLLCSGVVQPAREPSAHLTGQSGQCGAFRQPEMGALAPGKQVLNQKKDKKDAC